MKYLKIIFFVLMVFVIGISYFVLTNTNNVNKVKIKLVDCIDGDTAKFIIDGREENVRLLGIDTPESTNIQEEYGKEASNYTCDMLKNADNIYLEYDINSDKRDKYNRVLGWIFIDNNNLSELLVSRGYAEVKYIYGNYKYVEDLCIAQYNAYKDKLGIWTIRDYRYQDNYCYKNNYK